MTDCPTIATKDHNFIPFLIGRDYKNTVKYLF